MSNIQKEKCCKENNVYIYIYIVREREREITPKIDVNNR